TPHPASRHAQALHSFPTRPSSDLHVMHIVSALESKLRDGLDALDAFAACFPAGTLSGAPKVRAMQIIEELEPMRREPLGRRKERSEEHTSELQSRENLVCRLLLEK